MELKTETISSIFNHQQDTLSPTPVPVSWMLDARGSRRCRQTETSQVVKMLAMMFACVDTRLKRFGGFTSYFYFC